MIKKQIAEQKFKDNAAKITKNNIDSIIVSEAKSQIDMMNKDQKNKKIEKKKLFDSLYSDYVKYKENKMFVKK